MTGKKYSLGIAFSGGGAKAAAHCGAVQALNEFGLKPDVVSGTSAGSLVAAFYSAGFSPAQMIQMFLSMDFFHDIVTFSKPGGGLFDSAPLMQIINDKMPYQNIEDLPIPTYIIASDMDHGKVKVFNKGKIAPRLIASCSIPIVFKPMVIGGIHYIDGGVFQNLPVPAIRNLCDKVIAFSVRRIEKEEYKDTLLYTATRAYSMMFMSNIMADSRLADTYIELNTDGHSVYDIDGIADLFHTGYEDACKALEEAGYERQLPAEKITFNIEPRKEDPRESLLKKHIRRIEENITEKLKKQ